MFCLKNNKKITNLKYRILKLISNGIKLLCQNNFSETTSDGE